MNWIFIATLSALFSAASAVLQKKVLFKLNAAEFSFIASIVVILCSLFIPLTQNIFEFSLTTFFIIIIKSILGGFAFLLVMKSLEHNEISTALPLLGLTPAVTAVCSWIFLGDAISGMEWIGIGLIIAGTTFLEKRPGSHPLQSLKILVTTKKYYYVFGAVILFSISSVADKLLVSNIKIDPFVILFYQHCIYAVIFSIVLISQGNSLSKTVSQSKKLLPLIFLIAVFTLLYRYTQLEATKLAPVALVLAVKRTSIIYATFFGGKIFSEKRLPFKLIGAFIIVAAGFFILQTAG